MTIYTKVLSLEALQDIYLLLKEPPNADGVTNPFFEAAFVLMRNPELFHKTAREWTLKYAI
jgi:hypothetical protein